MVASSVALAPVEDSHVVNRRPVRSSRVSSVGWEPDEDDSDSLTQPTHALGTLEVEFKDGSVYRYEGVPLKEYEAMIGAGSVGRYLEAHIISAYDGERV